MESFFEKQKVKLAKLHKSVVHAFENHHNDENSTTNSDSKLKQINEASSSKSEMDKTEKRVSASDFIGRIGRQVNSSLTIAKAAARERLAILNIQPTVVPLEMNETIAQFHNDDEQLRSLARRVAQLYQATKVQQDAYASMFKEYGTIVCTLDDATGLPQLPANIDDTWSSYLARINKSMLHPLERIINNYCVPCKSWIDEIENMRLKLDNAREELYTYQRKYGQSGSNHARLVTAQVIEDEAFEQHLQKIRDIVLLIKRQKLILLQQNLRNMLTFASDAHVNISESLAHSLIADRRPSAVSDEDFEHFADSELGVDQSDIAREAEDLPEAAISARDVPADRRSHNSSIDSYAKNII